MISYKGHRIEGHRTPSRGKVIVVDGSRVVMTVAAAKRYIDAVVAAQEAK